MHAQQVNPLAVHQDRVSTSCHLSVYTSLQTRNGCCSVLESGRSITLAERGGAGAEEILAAPGFRIVATMNPGGDYGKRELSPALANRFTSIWVPAIDDINELRDILDARLTGQILGFMDHILVPDLNRASPHPPYAPHLHSKCTYVTLWCRDSEDIC
jgi:hypothetical protein